MKINTEETGLNIPLIPAKMHQAVLTDIVDYGTQKNTFNGEEVVKREVRIGFTFPNVTFTFDEERGPENRMKSVWVRLSGHPKGNLNKMLTAISGGTLPKEVELKDFLGRNVMVGITHVKGNDGTERDAITSYAPLMDGLESVSHFATKYFSLDEFDKEAFMMLGEKEQAKIKQAPEWEAISVFE